MTPEARLKKAEHASMVGMFAITLCLMVNCGGCFTVFLALPLSMWGLSLSRAALSDPDASDLVRAYARPAMYVNLISAIFSGLLILILVAYIALYIGLIAFMGLMVAATPMPPPPPPMPMPSGF